MAVNYCGKMFYNIGQELKIYMVTNANYAIAMIKMINYSFNFEKFIINRALFDQSLNKYLW
jgi:hypothetical protein